VQFALQLSRLAWGLLLPVDATFEIDARIEPFADVALDVGAWWT
jgi:hypothetical protein